MSNGLTSGLPVAGYRPQSEVALALVNRNKLVEEQVLRILDDLAARGGIDPYWLKRGRAQIEVGFMMVNRAVFRPDRARLPEDDPTIASPTADAAASAPAPAPAAAPASAAPQA